MGIFLYFQSCFIQLLSISLSMTTTLRLENLKKSRHFKNSVSCKIPTSTLAISGLGKLPIQPGRPTVSHLYLIEIKSYSLKLSYWVVARNYVMSREFIPNQSCDCGVGGHIRDHYNQFIKCPTWPVRRVFASLHSTYLRGGAQMFMCNIRVLDC